MTLDELDGSLLNGFHDAKISSLEVDYVKATAKLHVSFLGGSLDDSHADRETYQPAIVTVTGLCFCSIDPPDPGERFIPDGRPITVAGDPAKPDNLPSLPQLMAKLPEGVWCYRLFVHDWNRFIHIAGRNADLIFLGDKERHENRI